MGSLHVQDRAVSVRNDRGWKRRFDDPIPLPHGRQLFTLKDAADSITKLPITSRRDCGWRQRRDRGASPIEKVARQRRLQHHRDPASTASPSIAADPIHRRRSDRYFRVFPLSTPSGRDVPP